MARIVADRVLETSTTTGTGAYSLAGATVGFRAASTVCANGDTFTYFAEDIDAVGRPTGDWETGLGTWSTGNILTRTTIYSSSNSGSAVSWASGTRRIGLALVGTASLGPTTVTGNITADNFSGSSTGTNTGDQDLSTKQDVLVSGTNIKTINSTSLLGSGNISVQPSSTKLTSIAGLGGTSGILRKVSDEVYTLDTAAYTTNVGDVTLTDTQTLTNKTLTSPIATGIVLNDGYTEEVFDVTGTTPALSPNNGSIQTWTLSAASTPTAGTWAAGQSITLMVDDGTTYVITWTSLAVSWKTDGGAAPTLNTTGLTAITLWKVGTTIYGARVGDA